MYLSKGVHDPPETFMLKIPDLGKGEIDKIH